MAKKDALAILIGKGKPEELPEELPEEKPEDMPEEGDYEEQKALAADDVLRSIQDGDAALLKDSLEAFIDLCR